MLRVTPGNRLDFTAALPPRPDDLHHSKASSSRSRSFCRSSCTVERDLPSHSLLSPSSEQQRARQPAQGLGIGLLFEEVGSLKKRLYDGASDDIGLPRDTDDVSVVVNIPARKSAHI
ncbi:MAG: hypothetical protein SGPRY_014478 [Prymnesium sp.]